MEKDNHFGSEILRRRMESEQKAGKSWLGWALPLVPLALIVGIFATTRAYWENADWLLVSYGQVFPAAILLFGELLLAGVGIGLLTRHGSVIMERFRYGIAGIAFGFFCYAIATKGNPFFALVILGLCFLGQYRYGIVGLAFGLICYGVYTRGDPLITLLVIGLCLFEMARTWKSAEEVYGDLLFWLAVGCFIQVMLLNGDIPKWTNSKLKWSYKSTAAVLSLHSWVLCLLIPCLVQLFSKKAYTILKTWGSVILSLVTVVMIILSCCGIGVPRYNPAIVSTDKELDLATEDNIIVFAVDELDAQWIKKWFADNPAYRKRRVGFTFYDNVTSPTSYRTGTIPALLTGVLWDGDETYKDYRSRAYESSPLFQDLKENGYNIRIYTTIDNLEGADLGIIDNVIENPVYKVKDNGSLWNSMAQMAGYYAMPYQHKADLVLKRNSITKQISRVKYTKYSYSNSLYLNAATKEMQTGTKTKQFTLYNIPSLLSTNKNMTEEELEKEREETTKRHIKNIFGMIADMKETGVYDNSTIIIMGTYGGVELCQNPAVLVKRKGDSSSFRVDSTPLTFSHIWATLGIDINSIEKTEYQNNLYMQKSEDETVRMVVVNTDTRNAAYPEIPKKKNRSRFYIAGDANSKRLFFEAWDPRINEYKLGTNIYFFGEELTEGFAVSGVYAATENNRWNSGTGVTMRFSVSEPFSDLKVTLEGESFGEQEVYIIANSRLLGVKQMNGPGELSFIVPGDIVTDGYLELELGLPGAIDVIREKEAAEEVAEEAISEEMTGMEAAEETVAEIPEEVVSEETAEEPTEDDEPANEGEAADDAPVNEEDAENTAEGETEDETPAEGDALQNDKIGALNLKSICITDAGADGADADSAEQEKVAE